MSTNNNMHYYGYPIPDASIYYSQMPENYQGDASVLIVGPKGLISDEAHIQEMCDVGYVCFFGGYKLKVDKRETGYHFAGM